MCSFLKKMDDEYKGLIYIGVHLDNGVQTIEHRALVDGCYQLLEDFQQSHLALKIFADKTEGRECWKRHLGRVYRQALWYDDVVGRALNRDPKQGSPLLSVGEKHADYFRSELRNARFHAKDVMERYKREFLRKKE